MASRIFAADIFCCCIRITSRVMSRHKPHVVALMADAAAPGVAGNVLKQIRVPDREGVRAENVDHRPRSSRAGGPVKARLYQDQCHVPGA